MGLSTCLMDFYLFNDKILGLFCQKSGQYFDHLINPYFGVHEAILDAIRINALQMGSRILFFFCVCGMPPS